MRFLLRNADYKVSHVRSLFLLLLVFLGLPMASASAVPPVERAQVSHDLKRMVRHADKVSGLDSFSFLAEALPLLPVAKQIKILRGLAGDRSHPWVKTQALRRLFPFIASHKEATDRAKEHGFVTSWTLSKAQPSGPGRIESDHRAFMAHMAVDRALKIKTRADDGGAAFTSMEYLVPGDRQHILHGLITVTSSKSQKGLLLLGTSGDIAVSVNGQFHGSMTGLRHAQPDQLITPVRLNPGPNVVVVSLAPSAYEELRVYARIARPSGHADLALGQAPWKEADGWPLARDKPGGLRPLIDMLRPPKSDSSRLKRAVLKRSLGLPDTVGLDRRSLEDLMLTPEFAVLSAYELLLALELVPALEAKKSILLHYWAEGRREPDFALALAALCADQENPVAALKWLDRGGMRLRGEHHSIITAKVWRYGNEAERAWHYVNSEASLPDPSEALLKERAFAARRLGRFDLSLQVWEKLARVKSGAMDVVGAFVEDLQSLGQGQQALDTLDLLRQRHPHAKSLAFEAIRLSLALGANERGLKIAHSLVSRLGSDPSLSRNLALSYEELGDQRSALKLYRSVLEKAPNDPVARQAVRRLAPNDSTTGVLPTLKLSDARALPLKTSDPYELLEDITHVSVNNDGSYSQHRRRLIRVQEVLTSSNARTVTRRYDPSQVRVTVLQARIHRDDIAIDSVQQTERQLSKSWYGLYYDQRELSFLLEDPKVGDIVELTTRTDTVRSHPIPRAFELLRFLQGPTYAHRMILTLDVPESLNLKTQLRRSGGTQGRIGSFTREESVTKGRKRLVLKGRDIPPLERERRMPGLAELSPSFQATTFESFRALADEYSKLVDSQRVLTNAMREWLEEKKKMHRSGDGSLNRTQFVRTVVEGIAQEIRYVGLEFGIHGFQPYRTDQVWVRRFGDCKDQATLLSTLLNASGIPAHVVLMRTRPRGRLNNPLPALGLFDHAIVWLPETQQYVDTTERTMGLGTLPAADIGAQVLILNQSQPKGLTQTPIPSPLNNGSHSDYSIVLRDDGSGELSGHVTFRGVSASKQRATYGNKSKQVHRVARMVNNRYPGSSIKNHAVTHLADLQRPLELTFSAHIPSIGRRVGSGMRIRQPLGGSGLTSTYARTETRRYPLVIGSPSNFRYRYHYILPEGWTVPRLPENKTERSRFGTYQIQWQQDSGAVRGELHLRVDKDQINPDAYPEFYQFMQGLQKQLTTDLYIQSSVEVRP